MSLMKKVSIVLVIIALFSFGFSGSVHAEVSFTGKLVEPIMDFVVWIGDGTMDLAHSVLLQQATSVIRVDLTMSGAEWVGVVLGAVAGAVVIAAVTIATAGIATTALASIGVTVAAVSAGTVLTAAAVGATAGAFVVYNAYDKEKIALPIYSISPQEIFSNELPLFDVDFFNPSGTRTIQTALGGEVQVDSTAAALQTTIARWYGRLRDIAIVASLSILVYIGIRILISSTSGDKAKYKQMIMDWVIALCLLFVMQYIMSFSNIIVDKITNLVKVTAVADGIPEQLEGRVEKETYFVTVPYHDKILEAIQKTVEPATFEKTDLQLFDVDGEEYFLWPTNLMGKVRSGLQQVESGTATYMGEGVCYIALVLFTLFFIFTYFKRVLYMAFLTMVAPLVALTYPIDKINDGKAQAFNMWLKEYIFNLLIQPMHLLLYTMLITSAFELASSNIIYSIVAIGFIMPAEKLMRKFFGFEKAQTPGMLNGAAGAAMVMSGMNSLLSKARKGSSGGSGKHGGSDSEKDNTKINMHENFDAEEKFGAPKQEETPLRTERPTPEEDNNRFNTNNNPTVNDKPPVNDNPPGMYMSDSGLYVPDSYKNTPKNTGDNEKPEKPENPAGEPEKPEEEKDYIEDRIMNSVRNSTPYQTASRAKDAIVTAGGNARRVIGTKLGNAKTSLGKTRVIKGIKNLPNKSKIIDKGVNTSKKLAKTGSRAARFYAQGMANKISDKVKNGHLGRRAIKFAGGAALGTAAAMVAAGAGLASGDPTKMAQYVGAATAGGYAVGSSGVDKTADAIKVEGTKDVINETYHGKQEMKRREQIKEARQKQKDLQLRWKLEEKLGSKEAAKKYMQEEVPEIVKYGDFDNKTIVAMAQMKEKDGMSREETIAAALMSEQYLSGKNSRTLGDKAYSEFEKTIKRRGKERGLDGERLDKFNKKTQKAIDKLDKYRFD